MNKPFNRLLVLFVVLPSLLAACSSPNPPAQPAKATVNGVTKLDRMAGTADLSVSALSSAGQVLESGSLSDVSATVNSVSTQNIVTAQQTPEVSASVCGDISAGKGPITAVITLDASGSMELGFTNGAPPTDPTRLRGVAAKNFIDRMNAGDKAAIGSFNTLTAPTPGYRALKLWQTFSSDKAALKGAVDEATFSNGGTPLWDATVDSVEALETTTGGNKLALILTDGLDSDSALAVSQAVSAAQAGGVRVYAVGLSDLADSSELVDVATLTGGLYTKASQAEELEQLFSNIFNDAVAAGCIQLAFAPVPPPGTALEGTLSFRIDSKQFDGAFSVLF